MGANVAALARTLEGPFPQYRKGLLAVPPGHAAGPGRDIWGLAFVWCMPKMLDRGGGSRAGV
jgi:hypothetical protein